MIDERRATAQRCGDVIVPAILAMERREKENEQT